MDTLISIGSLVIFAITIVTVLALVFFYNEKSSWLAYVQKNALPLSLILVLSAMIGSLYYSEIMLYVPCKLCWILRIFIYPQLILILVALKKKTNDVWNYLPWLTGLAVLTSLLHNYGYYFNKILPGSCDTSASCNAINVTQFGFMSIPLMGLSVAVGLGAIILVKKYYIGVTPASK